MKVLFVISQLDFADHIAIPYLSAVAKLHGWTTGLCVLASDDLGQILSQFLPEVVAYSANVVGFEDLCTANRKAKLQHDFISILGGPQATFSPETFEASGMDAYCVGEGEAAFADFLDCVVQGASFEKVPNLITRSGVQPVRPLVEDLNSLPVPDRDLTLAHSYLKSTPKKTFYATRGCPYKCSYCCNNKYHELYRGKGRFVRRFSVERVISEIEYVKARYTTDFVKFGDDCFALKADSWLNEFADLYPHRVGVPFNCYLRMDTIDEDLLSLLKKAGCYSVHLSLDSTSKHVREHVLGRNFRQIDVVKVLRRIHAHGINTWVNFMLAAPESSLEDDLETIKISRLGRVTYPSYSTTVPMAGTELYEYSIKRGLLNESTHRSDMTGCSERTTLACFPEKEKDVRYNIYLLGAFISKLPFPLDRLATWMIHVVPPNGLFRKIRQKMYVHYIENRIFKLNVKA